MIINWIYISLDYFSYYSEIHVTDMILFYVWLKKGVKITYSTVQYSKARPRTRLFSFMLNFLFCILYVFKLCFAFCFLFSSNLWRSLERYEKCSVFRSYCEGAAVCQLNWQHHVLTLPPLCVWLSSYTVLIPASGYCFFKSCCVILFSFFHEHFTKFPSMSFKLTLKLFSLFTRSG